MCNQLNRNKYFAYLFYHILHNTILISVCAQQKGTGNLAWRMSCTVKKEQNDTATSLKKGNVVKQMLVSAVDSEGSVCSHLLN